MHSAPVRQWLRRLFGRDTSALVQAYIERGKALCASGEHAQGIDAYQRAIDADPKNPEAHYRAAIAWRDQQQFVPAVASYRRAIALKPDYIEAHNNLGVALQLQ